MRVDVTGEESDVRTGVMGLLRTAGHLVNAGVAILEIELTEATDGFISFDSVDGPVERALLQFVSQRAPAGGVWVQRKGGNANDRKVSITVPPTPEDAHAVEMGVLQAVSEIEHKALLVERPPPEPPELDEEPTPMVKHGYWATLWRALWGLSLVLLLAVPVQAQQSFGAPVSTVTASMDTVEDVVTLESGGLGAVAIQLTGTWAGTVSFEASVDGSTFVAVDAWPSNSATSASTSTGNGVWTVSAGGYNQVRVRFSTDTSGTVVAYLQGSLSGGKFIAAGAAGGTSLADDGDVTAGTTPGTPLIGFYQSAVTNCTDGDGCIAGVTQERELKVDITSNSAGVGGGVSYTEDEASANPIVGNATLMERDDALAGVTPAEADWIALRGSAEGALWTQDFNSDAILADTTALVAAVSLEDVASAGADQGIVALAIRDDTLDARSGTEGDFEYLHTDATGALWVQEATPMDVSAATVTVDGTVTANLGATDNAVLDDIVDGTLQVQVSGDALTAVQLIDNSIVADDAAFTPATTSVTMAGAEFDDAAPDSVGEGDGGAVRMSANRNLYTTLRDAAGNERGVNVTAGNELLVELGAGTAVVGEVTIGATTTAAGDLGKAEDVAHASGDVGVASWGVRDDAPPAAVSGAAGDYEPLHTNAFGAVWTEDHLCGSSAVTSVAISTASSGNVQLVALAANETVFVCGWSVMSAGTTAVQLIFGTGAACVTGETDLTGAYPLIANTGISVPNGGAVQMKGDVAEALCIENSNAIQIDGILTYVQRDITP